jgi:hypothetical protein
MILSVMLSGLTLAQSDAQGPVIARAAITPKEGIWVGQRVTLHIDVLGRGGWAQIKHVRDFEVSGAFVLRIESQGTRIQETLGGESYSGQRYELLVFPKRAGMIQVPAVPLEVEIKRWGAGAKSSVELVNTPAIHFQTIMPPGAQGEPDLISTTKFQARQQWDPNDEQMKVGDSLKRTLTFQAADVPGSAFAPLAYDPIDNVGIYPAQPLVEDHTDRGSLTGFRSETVTYIFKAPGKVQLPDLAITWWDMTKKQLKREMLQGRTLDVAPNPMVQTGEASQVTGKISATGKWWWSLLILPIIAALGWVLHHRLQSRWQRWRQERQESEAAYFRQFLKSVRSNDPRTTLNALMRWLDHTHQGPKSPRLDIFVEQYGDNIARQEASALIRSATSAAGGTWNGRRLSESLRKARSRWFSHRKQQLIVQSSLPALNPTHKAGLPFANQ